MFLLFCLYHKFMLPRPAIDVPAKRTDASVMGEFFKTFALFFKKKQMGLALLFLLIYRLGESQIIKLASPFLLDSREAGGLGLTTRSCWFNLWYFWNFSLNLWRVTWRCACFQKRPKVLDMAKWL